MKARKPTKPYRPTNVILAHPIGFRVTLFVNRQHDEFIAAQAQAGAKHRERVESGTARKPVQRIHRFNKPGWRTAIA